MIDKFCNEFNLYLLDRYKYKKAPSNIMFNTICAKRKKFDIYIRYKPNSNFWDNDTLVIARIGFAEEKKGNGMDLLRFLTEKSQRYNYEKIGIEQTNENGKAFAERFGFENFKDENNWIIAVDALKKRLKITYC